MKRRQFLQSGIAAMGTAILTQRASAQQALPAPPLPSKPTPPSNPFLREGNWYKAALHVHTTTSDGDVDVATRLKQYRDAGFHVVAVTDHWKTNDLSGFSDERFLAINGMEAHPKTSTGAPAHHFVCLDLPHPFELDRKQPAQKLIDTVRRVGGKVVYAHPYWTTHTINELLEVTGYIGVEVYNAISDLGNAKGYSQIHADQLFNKGVLVGLTSVDDIHKSAWLGYGWTMVRAKGLTKNEIMEAIGAGSFYASCGPTIEMCRIEKETIAITCSPASEIRFQFNGCGGGLRYRAEKDRPLTKAEWKFGRIHPKWVRAEVIDKDGKYAWTNPFVT